MYRESYADYAATQEYEYQRIKALPSASSVEKVSKIAALNALIVGEHVILSRLGEPRSAILDNAGHLLSMLPPPEPQEEQPSLPEGFGQHAFFSDLNAAAIPPGTPPATPIIAVVTPDSR